MKVFLVRLRKPEAKLYVLSINLDQKTVILVSSFLLSAFLFLFNRWLFLLIPLNVLNVITTRKVFSKPVQDHNSALKMYCAMT